MKKKITPLIIIALSVATIFTVSAAVINNEEVMKKVDSVMNKAEFKKKINNVNAIISDTSKSTQEVDAAIKEGKQIMQYASDNNLINKKDDISKEDLLFSIASSKSAYVDNKQAFASGLNEDRKMLLHLDKQINIVERLEKRIQNASHNEVYPLYLRYEKLCDKMKATQDIPSDVYEIVDSKLTAEELSAK